MAKIITAQLQNENVIPVVKRSKIDATEDGNEKEDESLYNILFIKEIFKEIPNLVVDEQSGIQESNESEKRIMCGECGQNFVTKEEVDDHINTQHDKVESDNCRSCDVYKVNETDLQTRLDCVREINEELSDKNELLTIKNVSHGEFSGITLVVDERI